MLRIGKRIRIQSITIEWLAQGYLSPKIRLMVNPDEDGHKALVRALGEFALLCAETTRTKDKAAWHLKHDSSMQLTQSIFKRVAASQECRAADFIVVMQGIRSRGEVASLMDFPDRRLRTRPRRPLCAGCVQVDRGGYEGLGSVHLALGGP